MTDIVATPGILSGQPRIEGERVAVLDVVEMVDVGYSLEETARELSLSTEDVRAATEYYRRHRQELAEWEREREGIAGRSDRAEA